MNWLFNLIFIWCIAATITVLLWAGVVALFKRRRVK